jgi:DNA-binding beta-propeller fold protein YncE
MKGIGNWTIAIAILAVAACAPVPQKAEPGSAPQLAFPPPPEAARFYFERTIQSSADIEIVDRRASWRRVLTGETATAIGFSKPYDVVVCQGRVYVSDTVRRSVLMFNAPAGEFRQIGDDEPGMLRKPLGIATDDNCNLYVADGTANAVMIYDQDGQYLRAIGGGDWFDRLAHVESDPDGQRIYCVDTGGVDSERHQVRVFDAQSGEHLFDFGGRGEGPGELNLPKDIAMGPDRRLYVVDSGNFRIQVFEDDGRYVRQIGAIGVRPGQFSRPKGVDTDTDGNIYVSDAAFGNFQIFNPDGQLLLFVGDRSESPAPAKFLLPAGLAVDEDGRVYMTDQFFRKLDVFRPASLATDQGYLGAQSINP